VARNAIGEQPADLPHARSGLAAFARQYPGVRPLIAARSAAASQETDAALEAAGAAFAEPAATAETAGPALARLLDRFNFGLALVNAAARAADLHSTGVTDADRAGLRSLDAVAAGLRASLARFPADPAGAAAGGGTGPGSPFAEVQPALEAKAQQVNTAATLRAALATYAALVTTAPAPAATVVEAANKAALEQVAIAQQVLVGRFWTDPGLQAFVAGLPAG
jgi:hypothetical protein